ncbi:MAG: hypothetical protein AB1898_05450 [Acidobacteriota bacterium]
MAFRQSFLSLPELVTIGNASLGRSFVGQGFNRDPFEFKLRIAGVSCFHQFVRSQKASVMHTFLALTTLVAASIVSIQMGLFLNWAILSVVLRAMNLRSDRRHH